MRYREYPDIFYDIFFTSLMLGNLQLANQGADNLVRWSRSPSVIFITTSMTKYQVKVKYREERFSTILIKEISFAKLMQAIKQNCSPLAHLPTSNIHVRYLNKDHDMINLLEDPDDFCIQRDAKECKRGQGSGLRIDFPSGKLSRCTIAKKTVTNGHGNAQFFSF